MSVKVRRKRQRVTSGSMGMTGYSSLASILALMYQGPSSARARSRAPSRDSMSRTVAVLSMPQPMATFSRSVEKAV